MQINIVLLISCAARLGAFFRRIRNKISDLFTPEEVEVTFKMEGKKMTYTYTKVEHKQVA